MIDALKEAGLLCKTMGRNGYDAHVVNMPLQQRLLEGRRGPLAVDLACEAGYPVIAKIFRDAKPAPADTRLTATLEQDGVLYRFYPLSVEDSQHPELSLMRLTPTMGQEIPPEERLKLRLTGFGGPSVEEAHATYDGFEPLATGEVRLAGLPDDTLRHNYLLAVRALRFSANFDLPIEENTRLAIVRAAARVLDYVPAGEIVDEWRKVAAESMHVFVKLLFDVHLLQGLVPELAALSCVRHLRNKRTAETEDLLTHTIACVKHYPEGPFHHDWLGTMAMLFHDVGKVYTAEYVDGTWTFFQHHRVGAQVTRKILRRLHFSADDIDLICHLVRYHMRFCFMMTDKGIRRFMALDEYPRLIEMSRADLQARDEVYTSFNHNMKYLERGGSDELMTEPLLNGNEIMKATKLAPGPMVGRLRDELLKAQIAGDVTDVESALAFVKELAGTAG